MKQAIEAILIMLSTVLISGIDVLLNTVFKMFGW